MKREGKGFFESGRRRRKRLLSFLVAPWCFVVVVVSFFVNREGERKREKGDREKGEKRLAGKREKRGRKSE